MLKRVLCVMLAMALGAGVLAMTASATEDETVEYRVGYAKVDINPYWSLWEATGGTIPTDKENYATDASGNAIGSDHLMPLPMGGYGGNTSRLSRPELVDDNGSGLHADNKVFLTSNRYTKEFAQTMGVTYEDDQYGQNDGDGLYATCVAIRQNATAAPVLMISVDLIGFAESYCSVVKARIITALKEMGIPMTPDRILINATHTHGGVSLGESFTAETTYVQKLWDYNYNTSSGKTVSFLGSELAAYLSAYKNHVYAQLTEVAVQALGDSRANVEMRKGTVDASEVTGYQLNGVRHKKAQLTTVVDGESQTVDYVTGSSFNVDLPGEREISGVSDSDDRLHVLVFSFPDQTVAPILVVNWRTHTTWNNKMKSKAYNNLSADFVAPMRYQLEQWGYRFLFNYGTGGNLGTGGTPSTYNIGSSESATALPANAYGFDLAYAAAFLVNSELPQVQAYRAAKLNTIKAKRNSYTATSEKYQLWDAVYTRLQSLTSPGTTLCEQGPIRLETTWYDLKAQTSTDAGYEAALYHNLLAKSQGATSADVGGLQVQESPYGLSKPYPLLVKAGEYTMTYTEGGQEITETVTVSADFVLASQYHANSQINNHGAVNKKRLGLTALTLGQKVAFATVPFEASDRYSMEANLETANQYNDWDLLVNDSQWGVPFVMSLVNGSEGYVPNNLAYTYTQELEAKYIAGTCEQAFVSGSYEANNCYAAAGEGEKIVKTLNTLLRGLENEKTPVTKEGYCVACKAYVTWQAVDDKLAEDYGNGFATGHYYLAEDYTSGYGVLVARGGQTVCFDLNGHPYHAERNTGAGRAFYVYGTLNLQDSGVGGTIKGKQYPTDGCTLFVSGDGVVNHYSGNLTVEDVGGKRGTLGGVVYVEGGVYNMYGGTIYDGRAMNGGNVHVRSGQFNQYGGTIYGGSADSGGNVFTYVIGENQGIYNLYGGTIRDGVAESYGGNITAQGGAFHMYGGTVTGGTATNGNNLLISRNNPGPGTFRYAGGYIPSGTHIMGYLVLGGQATMPHKAESALFLSGNSYKVTLDGEFSGKVKITNSKSGAAAESYDFTTAGGKVGSVETGASIAREGYIKVGSNFYATANGDVLTLTSTAPSVAIAKQKQGDSYTYYTSLTTALRATTTEQAPLVLLANASSLTLSKNLYLDLNGYDVTAVNKGRRTLVCMDSATDDYVGAYYGTLPATAAAEAATNYLASTEEDKTSFHRYDLKLTGVAIRPGATGIYYQCFIGGDEKVKAQVQSFGMAMRVNQVATAQDILSDVDCKTHVWYEGSRWRTGTIGAELTGVVVQNIMKTNLKPEKNDSRAQIPVYGVPYMVLENGTMLFGNDYHISLRQLVESIDANYSGSINSDLVQMYKDYASAMEGWAIPNLKAKAAG